MTQQKIIQRAGRGWYQAESESAREILPGTVIHIPAEEYDLLP